MNRKIVKIRKGLTLIELAIVVAIVGVIFTLLLTSLKNLVTTNVEEESAKFKKILEYCYKTARITNVPFEMILDLDKNTYKVVKFSRDENGLEELVVFDTKEFPKSFSLISIMDIRGFKYYTGKVFIPFTYQGISEDYSLHFGNEGEIKQSIIIYRYNGKVEIKPGEFSRMSKELEDEEEDLNGESNL